MSGVATAQVLADGELFTWRVRQSVLPSGVLAVLVAIQITVQARSVQPGELVVLSISLPEPHKTVRVRAFDHDVPTFPAEPSAGGSVSWQALIGIDLDRKPGPYRVSVDAGGLSNDTTIAVQPKRFPTRRLAVDEKFVNPPPSVEARIKEESALLARIYEHPAAERQWTTPFERPVAEAANSRFGTRSIFNGQPRNAHGGADFLSPAGTPIHAPNAGRVVIARDLYFSGGTVVIDHGHVLFSMLAHMSAIDVHEGDTVKAGDAVGKVGATGRVTGAHLHWAVRLNDARIDPLSVLQLLGQR